MDDKLVQEVRDKVQDVLPLVTYLRHSIHSEPEIGLNTIKTARKVREMLSGTCAGLRDPLLGHDVVADMSAESDQMICLRADMDAIPVREENDFSYTSLTAGAMHACGHDGHTAMLVGAALVLNELRERLPVNVRFVFQPGEEVTCGGRDMVERGVCDGCESAYAIHGWPGLPAGAVSTRKGALFAGGAHFEITVNGQGCHGAMPETGINPIPIACRIVEQFGTIHGEMNAEDGTVVSVCTLHAGSASNIIPESAFLSGTTRYLDAEVGNSLETAIRETAAAMAIEGGGSASIEYDRSYDLPVINSASGFGRVRDLAERYVPGGWLEAEKPTMAMEDFAYYLKDREGAMFWLGLGKDHPRLHSPTFDFNDDVLETGILMLCLLALES